VLHTLGTTLTAAEYRIRPIRMDDEVKLSIGKAASEQLRLCSLSQPVPVAQQLEDAIETVLELPNCGTP